MVKKVLISGAALAATLCANAQVVSFGALSSFGGDGWLTNAEAPTMLDAVNNCRGIAYNASTGHVVVASRTGGNKIHLVNELTGMIEGVLDMTGVSGGAIGLAQVAVGDDGAIYAANVTTNATTSAFKIYKWANEAAAPVVVYSGAPLGGARIGDSFDVFGSGANTRIVAGYGSSPSVAGNNGYAVFTDNGAGGFNANHFGFGGTTPGAGDHRLGITFYDSDTIIGNQTGTFTRLSDFTIGGAASYLGSVGLTAGNERMMDILNINGYTLMGTIDSGATTVNDGTLVARLYDMGNPMSPVSLASARNMPNGTALNANGNATGEFVFGKRTGNLVYAYSLGSNNGIQAYQIEVVPEPASMTALALGALALIKRRKKA